MRHTNLPLLVLSLSGILCACSGNSLVSDDLAPDAAEDSFPDQASGDSGAEADAQSDQVAVDAPAETDANSCVPPKLFCQDHCIDPKTDYTNCGTCGHACSTGEVCSAGKCDFVCSGGTVKCGNSCVDTKLDINNCGTCGKICDVGQVCSAGKCDLLCSGGTEKCGNSCVDTKLDTNNCGTCGTACPSGESCVASKCELVCSGGTSKCGSLCLNLQTDPKNCAACGTVCEEDGICDAGHCKIPFPNGIICLPSLPDIPNRGWPRFVTGDFNQDNITDVITNDELMLGRGNGTFKAVKLSRDLAFGFHPVVRDINGDGLPDLVSTDGGHTIFTDLYQSGVGFQHGEYETIVVASSVAIGELNGDSMGDIVFVSETANVLGIMFNKGDGTFFPPVLSASAGSPISIFVGDFNGDKINDIFYLAGGKPNVLEGDGKGSFNLTATSGSTYYTQALVHDFDNDGDLDFASTYGGSLTFAWNNGAGYFFTESQDDHAHHLGYPPPPLSVADINGDGKMDIVGSQVPDAQGFANVYSFTNLGNHKFEEKLLVNDRIKSIALGDVTQDGKPELITLGGKFSDPDDMTLQVLRNRGDGTFALPQDRPLNHSFKSIISDDFNGDGKADFVALDKSMYLYYNVGNGAFSDPLVLPLPSGADQWALMNSGDTNGDGKPDLLVTGAQMARTYLNLGNGFAAPIELPWFGPEGAAGLYGRVYLVDMDGDGKLDIFGGVGPETTPFQPAVLLGRSDGTFFPPKYLSTQLVWDLDAADLNNDGRADLVACTHDLKMKVWLSNPDATLTFVSEYPGCVKPTIADLDGDSLPDIVNKNGVGSVALLFNKGDGTFEKTSFLYGKHNQGEVTLVDLNNDSLPDIVVPDDQETNSVSIMLNQGGRKFSQEYRYRTNQKPDIDAMGNNRVGNVFFLDLNSDGSPDLITDGGKAFKGMRVLLNGCGL